jgi:hypothetical protein
MVTWKEILVLLPSPYCIYTYSDIQQYVLTQQDGVMLSSSHTSKYARVLALTPPTSMAQHPDLWAWGTKHSAMLVACRGSTKLRTAEAELAKQTVHCL